MSERGVALILVLIVMMTMSALAMSLAIMVSTESRVAANYRDGMEVLYGAEAALDRVLPDLAAEPDLTGVVSGLRVSSFIDGPVGLRRMPDGTFADLHALTASLTEPGWRLYGYGQLDAHIYTVVWIGSAGDPESGRLNITAHGYGPAGTRRVIEATIAKTGHGLSVLSWREVR